MKFVNCKKYSNRDDVELLQVIHKGWQNAKIIRILYHMALLKSPNWVIRSDSDEILESGMKDMTLRDAIIKVDSEGNNTIQFDCFEFFLTDNDDESKSKVKDRMKYYSFQNDLCFRAWKIIPGTRPEFGWGNNPIFPEYQKYKIHPKKFVLRHYRFRSIEQSNKKIFEVVSRTKGTTEGELGTHRHYEMIAGKKPSFIVDHSILTKYNDDDNWNLERKYFPYIQKIHKKNEELFNDDGSLKNEIKDVVELRLDIKQLAMKNSKLQIQIKNVKENNFKMLKKLKRYRGDYHNNKDVKRL